MDSSPTAQVTAEAPSAAPRARLRQTSRNLRRDLSLILALVAAVDGFFVEPDWIVVTRHSVSAGRDLGTPPIKIAHLSDLHTNGMGRRERRLLALLESEKPDLLVVTGDSLGGSRNYQAVRELLSRLHAPLGVWVVRGNWENWWPLQDERAFYASADVHFLLNEARPVRGKVWIAGLDDPASGMPELNEAIGAVPEDAYTIVIAHSPMHFKHIAKVAPLALAGHTHGGQVRIPFVYPFWLPRGSSEYLEGWYRKGDSRMYVSRGIGTSNLPVRFLCRPELPIITVRP